MYRVGFMLHRHRCASDLRARDAISFRRASKIRLRIESVLPASKKSMSMKVKEGKCERVAA
jgi:hypothetical protein